MAFPNEMCQADRLACSASEYFRTESGARQSVDALTPLENGVIALHTLTGEVHYTRSVIVAIGRGIAEVQKLELDSAHHYEQVTCITRCRI